MRKIIIAGFPGVGKSTAAKIDPQIVADMESSDFHWIIDPEGKKNLHPAWPDNYVKAIEMMAKETDGLENYRDLLYICCSTHKDVIKRLIEDRFAVIIVAPKDKQTYLNRYMARGSSEEFVKSMDENWDSYMEDIKSYGMPVIYNDEYLHDILFMPGTYDYLCDKVDNVEQFIFGQIWDE